MKRALLFISFSITFFAVTAFAQEKAFDFDQTSGTNTLQAPDQLRRAAPPSKDATPQDLETQADEMRAKKDFADALDYYRAAIKKSDSAILENKAGLSELSLFHLSEAQHRFEKATKMNKTYGEAYNNLGVIYYLRRNYGKSIKSYARAVETAPDNAVFRKNMATSYFAKGDVDHALVEYEQAMQIDPDILTRQSSYAVSAGSGSPADRARFDFTIAKVFAKQGDTDRCLLYLRKAIEDGFPTIDDVYKQVEFAKVVKDPRFVTLMASKPQAVK